MVYLNENISFNVFRLRENIKKEISNSIKDDISFNKIIKLDSRIKESITDMIEKKINKKINEIFSNDYFVYLNMNENICTYKIRKGKLADRFCCKKITTNGDKSKYVCTIHNKNHVSKKRLKASEIPCNSNTINNNNAINIPIDNSIKKNTRYTFKKSLKNKNIKKNKIKVFGIINFNDIISKLL